MVIESIETKPRADFHVHLGNRSLEDFLTEARRRNVVVVCALDRGLVRVDLLKELMQKGRDIGTIVLPGVEVLTFFPGLLQPNQDSYLEIIGLNFDIDHPRIHQVFSSQGEIFQKKHQEKISFQKNFLEENGFTLAEIPENLQQWTIIKNGEVLDTAIRICQIAAIHPGNHQLLASLQVEIQQHLARRPQDRAVNPEAKFLYWKFFAQGQPGYKRWQLDSQTIISAIHDANGVVILSHPTDNHQEVTVEMLEKLFQSGIDGIEGWDNEYFDKHLVKHTIQRGKLVLGGSGQDSSNYQNRHMGASINPIRRLQDLQNYLSNRNNPQ